MNEFFEGWGTRAGLLATSAALMLSIGTAAAQSNPTSADMRPTDVVDVEARVPGNPVNRVYVYDSVFAHLTDSRLNIYDGTNGEFVGMLSNSFNGFAQMSKDQKQIWTSTSYYSRVPRGTRTDTIDIWDANTLKHLKEIIVAPKRANALNYDGLFTRTNDGQFALLQNATPATSVTVADMQKGVVTQEITATAGCWNIIPTPGAPRSFTTICGDGSLLTVKLGADGKLAGQSRSKPMFSVKDDPVFINAATWHNKLVFVSFNGNIYTADMDASGVKSFEPVWSILSEKDKAGKWAPGGFNLMAANPDNGYLYILMHPDAVEGSHKNPAKEIRVYNLKTKKEIGSVPGEDVLSLAVNLATPTPQLLTIDGGNAHIYDISSAQPKLVRTIKNAGEAALQLFGPTGVVLAK